MPATIAALLLAVAAASGALAPRSGARAHDPRPPATAAVCVPCHPVWAARAAPHAPPRRPASP
jgi:cytochrome c553